VKIPIREAIRKREVFNSEESLYLVNRDGLKLYATYSVSPIQNPEDSAQGAVVVICTYENENKMFPKKVELPDFASDPEQKWVRVPSIYVKRDGQFIRVLIQDILWIEAMENYVQLVTQDDKFMVHTTMKKIADRFVSHGFVRVHRSYIVPLDQVDAIEENRIFIGGQDVPIGKSYRQELLKALTFI
jgi:DNA-binding LytR/AlgR family response regulator